MLTPVRWYVAARGWLPRLRRSFAVVLLRLCSLGLGFDIARHRAVGVTATGGGCTWMRCLLSVGGGESCRRRQQLLMSTGHVASAGGLSSASCLLGGRLRAGGVINVVGVAESHECGSWRLLATLNVACRYRRSLQRVQPTLVVAPIGVFSSDLWAGQDQTCLSMLVPRQPATVRRLAPLHPFWSCATHTRITGRGLPSASYPRRTGLGGCCLLVGRRGRWHVPPMWLLTLRAGTQRYRRTGTWRPRRAAARWSGHVLVCCRGYTWRGLLLRGLDKDDVRVVLGTGGMGYP